MRADARCESDTCSHARIPFLKVLLRVAAPRSLAIECSLNNYWPSHLQSHGQRQRTGLRISGHIGGKRARVPYLQPEPSPIPTERVSASASKTEARFDTGGFDHIPPKTSPGLAQASHPNCRMTGVRHSSAGENERSCGLRFMDLPASLQPCTRGNIFGQSFTPPDGGTATSGFLALRTSSGQADASKRLNRDKITPIAGIRNALKPLEQHYEKT